MTDLADYVEKLINQGYSEDYIKSYLENYGYDNQTINNALKRASRTGQTVKHEHHISKSAIAYTLLLLILAAGIVIGVLEFAGMIGSEALLDFQITKTGGTVQAGGQVSYSIKLTNLGDAEKFDAVVNYKILDDNGEAVYSNEETFAVSTSVIRDGSIQAPNQPGTYTLEAIANYDGKKASSSFTFQVQPRNSQETKDQSTEDNILEKVRNKAATQPSQAEQLCMKLENQTQKDDCLFLVVKESNRAQFCQKISDTTTRDNCYMNFIVEGQTQYCTEVQQENNKNYCDRLKDVQIMSQSNQ